MASEEQAPSERKPRKSVAFTDEQLVVDADGSVTMVTAAADEALKDPSAQSHASRTPPLSAALATFHHADDAAEAPPPTSTTDDAPAAADDAGLDLSLLKKKKKKASSSKPKDEDGEAEGDDGGLDLSMKKKKKKKAKDATGAGAEDDDFAAKLKQLEVKEDEGGAAAAAAAGGEEGGDAAAAAAAAAAAESGDMEAGTGIWAHDETRGINYPLLLSRFFTLLQQKNPDHALSGTKTYKIPPPQCMREGNRKTVFANIAEICRRMKRSEEHLTSYLFAELGTIGSVDGSRRLIIKGRWTPAQLETVLRKYIIEYVTCKTCKSPDTELNKAENRLYFVTCNNCGSRRSVTAIKTGFSAQVGKRKKMQG
ncbi:putative eukaryotic translation initiation factor 2 subunit beta [Beauveria bassiana D1-5]|uniref:Putative eukaryotic translation initiation factor 2 subunit beta n=1 Tax=Beauveria bassiana D1-5 TaxID=1245745 RepID=A0A0A2VY39_BEABA|nr:putative eukaryotic translation initiation factor 2 subunit beta [Beauveria bassiana D1-5]